MKHDTAKLKGEGCKLFPHRIPDGKARATVRVKVTV